MLERIFLALAVLGASHTYAQQGTKPEIGSGPQSTLYEGHPDNPARPPGSFVAVPKSDEKTNGRNANTAEKAREHASADPIRSTDWIMAASAAASAIFAGILAVLTWQLFKVGKNQHEAMISDQRAFVFVETFDTNFINNQLIIQPRWRNSGSTPTRFMTNYVNWKPFSGDLPDDYTFPDLDGVGNPVSSDRPLPRVFVGPKAVALAQALVLPIATLDALRTSQQRVFVWGWAKYGDVFGGHHVTRFCNELKIVPADLESSGAWNPGDKVSVSVSFPVYGRHNCTDDECDA